MPRIRTIKPEFWTDGAIISLPYETRLFYIGMWNHACDRGHMSDDPFGLKLKIMPADPVDGADLVQQLVASGRVVRVDLPDGRPYLSIPRFSDHQRVDTRWNSRCPVCAHLDSGEPAQTHASSVSPARTQKEGKGGEGKGKEGRGTADAPPQFCPKHPNGTDAPCRACGDHRRAYAAWQAEQKNKPTPTPSRDAECLEHPGYPLPCDKCRQIAEEDS